MPPKKKRRAGNVPEVVSLEAAMEELTSIVSDLESGQHPLNEALQKFERGMQLLKECSQQLENAAGRIEQVRQIADDGVVVEPFDGTATVDREQSDSADSESASLF